MSVIDRETERSVHREETVLSTPVPIRSPGSRERVLVFANRFAGTLMRQGGETPLEHFAREAGLEPEVVYTRSSSHLRHLLRERVVGRESRVIVAGGDGTLHAAVQELAKTDVALGILPQGTANNFATALRLPMDLPSAFKVIAGGEVCSVSLGEAGGEYFSEAAGIGVFAEALALTNNWGKTKNLTLMARALVRLMVSNRPYEVSMVLDGERRIETAFNVTVANSFCFGANLPIAPQARLTDEHLDVVVIEPLNRREWLPYYRAIRSQTHMDLPKVQMLQAQSVRLESRGKERVHVDDRTHKQTPVEIRIVPRALNVIVDQL